MKYRPSKKQTTPKPNKAEDPQVDNKPAITPVVVNPVTPPPAASTEKPKEENPQKEKAPSISAVVRKLVIQNPDKTVDEISQLLISSGWDAGDVEKRKSTIATLRTDALAILKIAKECGWEKN